MGSHTFRYLRFGMLAALAMSLGSVSQAYAQTCDALLHQGIYNTSSSASLTEKTASYFNWFCQQQFSSQSEAQSYGASLGLPLDGIPVQFGGTASSSNWSQWYSSFCSQVSSDETLRQSLSTFVQTVDQGLIQAFNNCVTANGLHVWLEYGSNPNTFTFAAVFRSPGVPPYVKLRDFQASSNVVCDGLNSGPQKNVRLTGSTFRTLCSRKDNGPVSIIVNATVDPMGGGALSLPAVSVPTIVVAPRRPLYAGPLMLGNGDAPFTGSNGHARVYCAMGNLDPNTNVVANAKLYDRAGTNLEGSGNASISPGGTYFLASRGPLQTPGGNLGVGGPYYCTFEPANGSANLRATIGVYDDSTGESLAGPLEAH